MTDKAHKAWKKRRRKALWSNPTFRNRHAQRQRKLSKPPCHVAKAKLLNAQLRSNAAMAELNKARRKSMEARS